MKAWSKSRTGSIQASKSPNTWFQWARGLDLIISVNLAFKTPPSSGVGPTSSSSSRPTDSANFFRNLGSRDPTLMYSLSEVSYMSYIPLPFSSNPSLSLFLPSIKNDVPSKVFIGIIVSIIEISMYWPLPLNSL